jgi:hypothetical protein
VIFTILYLCLGLSFANPHTTQVPTERRLVAIGDLHGDLSSALDVLRLAKVVDAQGRWCAGDTVLVQTGDTTDRGPNSRAIMDLVRRLQGEATAAGGQVVALLGNHEVMNTQGDWRYVNPEDVTEFGSISSRRAALSKDGEYGRWLATLDAVAKVEDTIFVHGGLRPDIAKLGIEAINTGVRNEMFGSTRHFTASEGPLWFRGYVQAPEAEACPLLDEALQILGAKRMVVGHTTQRQGKVLSRCDGKLAVIDIGISAHYGGNLGYWESLNGDARAVYTAGTTDLIDP